jgi:hypothetical protein
LPGDAVVIRGGLFEVARLFYHRQLPALDAPGAQDMTAAVERAMGRREGIATWAEWAAARPWHTIDWRDRFYLEQRVGGWLAALEQALDLCAPERLHLANSDRTLAALLSIPVEQRTGDGHHRVLVERFAPQLLTLPLNPPERDRTPPVTRARIALGRWRRRLLGRPG